MKPTHFLLCPTCSRSVPAHTQENFCPNDGAKLLEACPSCAQPILTPFARFCAGCGFEFASLNPTPHHTHPQGPTAQEPS